MIEALTRAQHPPRLGAQTFSQRVTRLRDVFNTRDGCSPSTGYASGDDSPFTMFDSRSG